MLSLLTIISLLAALIFFILGMLLIVSGKDNYTKIIIGTIVVIISSVIFAGLSTLIPQIIDGSLDSFPRMIIPAKTIMILLLLLILFSIFPLLALNPDWSKKKVTLIIMLPVIGTFIAYLPFATGVLNETLLYSEFSITRNFKIIFDNLTKFDVIYRFIILLLILIVPSTFYAASSLIHISHKNRKPSANYRIYQWALCFLSIIIFSYSLYLPYSQIVIVIFLPLFLAILLVGYYRNSSYLTTFIQQSVSLDDKNTDSQKSQKVNLSSVDASFLDIWVRMDELIKKDARFRDPDLQIQEISDEINISKMLLNDALHRKGYNGFKEYLNYLRLNLFKELAEKDPGRDITDLYETAGFSSKSTFYRFFNMVEGITPSEYMKKLCRFHNM